MSIPSGWVFIFFLLIGAASALIVGNIAEKKGYQSTPFSLFGFFFSIIAVIVALIMPYKSNDSTNQDLINAQAIAEYKKLYDEGAITIEEYETKKRELLSQS